MEILGTIEIWVLPAIDIMLAILCFSFIRHSGGIFLAIGFIISMLASVVWPIADIFYSIGYESVYELTGHINFLIYLIAAGFFAAGIVMLGGLSKLAPLASPTSVPAQPTTNPYQAPSADMSAASVNMDQGFGNILLYILPLSLGALLLVVALIMQADYSMRDFGEILLLPAVLAVLFGYIYLLVVLHRLWKFIIEQSKQFGLAPSIETPGKAVGFLFIPFFNYYWIFIAYGKLAKDLNALAKQKGVEPSASEGLGITIPILIILGIIPFVGYLTSFVASFILVPIYFSGVIKLCSHLKSVDTGR